MNILLACQKSGELRELLRLAGHNAWTCDLEPPEDSTQFHIQGDVIKSLYGDFPGWAHWDCMIAMPECRNLCSSGQHRNDKPGQRTTYQVEQALQFFITLDQIPIPHKILENSIGIITKRYRKWDQLVHPYMFGDDASKGTCFWATDFPLLDVPVKSQWVQPRMVCQICKATTLFAPYGMKDCMTCKVKGKVLPRWANQTDSGQNRLGPSPTRSADRARTYPGIARALADAVGRIT